MRWRSVLFLAVVLALSTAKADAGAVLDRVNERGKLVIAAVPEALPQAARDADGKLVGFDIDVARMIAEQLGVQAEFVTPPWTEILEGNWGNKWDLSVSSMTPTLAREKNLVFPAIYRYSAVVLVVNKDNTTISKVADASGKRIGVKAHTTFELFLKGDLTIYKGDRPFNYVIQDPHIVTFDTKAQAMDALTAGDGVQLDAVVTSLAHAQSAINNGKPVKIVPGFLYFEPLAVAVDKGDPEFAAVIARIVDTMREEGDISDLSIKWFGIDLTE